MRYNKFRAWDKQDRRMITHEQDFIPLKVTNLGVLRLNPNIEKDNWEFMNRDRFYLMQYTGLKDRNGKDIYEGDILSRKNLKYIVKWSSNHMFALTVDNMEVGMLCEVTTEEFEIVGNIYENPELLSNR